MGPQAATGRRFILSYDDHCKPCRRLRWVVSLLDNGSGLGFQSIADSEREGLLDSIPPGLRFSSMHLILPDRTVLSGPEALAVLLKLVHLGSLPSRLLSARRAGPAIAALVYDSAARLRGNTCDP